jgi:hypothetical protein
VLGPSGEEGFFFRVVEHLARAEQVVPLRNHVDPVFERTREGSGKGLVGGTLRTVVAFRPRRAPARMEDGAKEDLRAVRGLGRMLGVVVHGSHVRVKKRLPHLFLHWIGGTAGLIVAGTLCASERPSRRQRPVRATSRKEGPSASVASLSIPMSGWARRMLRGDLSRCTGVLVAGASGCEKWREDVARDALFGVYHVCHAGHAVSI